MLLKGNILLYVCEFNLSRNNYFLNRIPSTGVSSIKWTPVSKDSDDSAISFLKISSPTNITMNVVEDMGRTSFWDSLDFNENEHYSHHKNKDI